MRHKNYLTKPKIYNTNLLVPESMVGQRVLIYTGRRFISLLLRDDHVNKLIGSFILTKVMGSKIHKNKKVKKEKGK